MSIIIPHLSPNHLDPSLQESSSWAGKVVTKAHATASCIISSVGSIAQSILSNFIYVGTLGRYTLDDLKDYFSTKVPIEKDCIEEKSISEPNSVLEKAKSTLKRQGSKISVSSTLFRQLRSPLSSDSQHQSIYPDLRKGVKLSTHIKTPIQRYAEMTAAAKEKICNQGK